MLRVKHILHSAKAYLATTYYIYYYVYLVNSSPVFYNSATIHMPHITLT